MCRAARGAQLDPDRLSFTHSVRVLRRKLARPPAFPTSAVSALAQLHPAGNPSGAIREQPGPRRIPRGLKRKMSGYPLRHPGAHGHVPLQPPVISAYSSKRTVLRLERFARWK